MSAHRAWGGRDFRDDGCSMVAVPVLAAITLTVVPQLRSRARAGCSSPVVAAVGAALLARRLGRNRGW